jgi:hypothetical protein
MPAPNRLSLFFSLVLFGPWTGCNCSATYHADLLDVREDVAADSIADASVELDGMEAEDPGADTDSGRPEAIDVTADEITGICTGEYAYLHGDLWPMWYNMRVACDPEHKAWWRCERIHGEGAAECTPIASMYNDCINNWDSGRCMIGVYAPVLGTGCWECAPEWPEGTCDTRTFDYDTDEMWGSYYGVQWSTHLNLHRHLTVKVKDSAGNEIVGFSTCPQRDECYMGGGNFGIGPEPQGVIQEISNAERYTAKFGTFACIRVPAGVPLTLWASWMNEFCHTCSPDYPSYPYTPCWTEDIPVTFEPGRHYLWTERGVELLDGCDGPPPYIMERLPEASCDTSAPTYP